MCAALDIEPIITLAYDLNDPMDWADLVECESCDQAPLHSRTASAIPFRHFMIVRGLTCVHDQLQTVGGVRTLRGASVGSQTATQTSSTSGTRRRACITK